MRVMVLLVFIGCLLFLIGIICGKAPHKNTPAPNFSLYDYERNQFVLQRTLSEGNWVVLVFYPKDSSLICTKQMCNIRDLMPTMPPEIKVVGISSDSAASHQAFARTHSLPFPLLIDKDNHVRTLFGANTWGGRVTIIINPQGHIVKRCTDMLSLDEHIGMIQDLIKRQR